MHTLQAQHALSCRCGSPVHCADEQRIQVCSSTASLRQLALRSSRSAHRSKGPVLCGGDAVLYTLLRSPSASHVSLAPPHSPRSRPAPCTHVARAATSRADDGIAAALGGGGTEGHG
jgi:hypothetical protein